MTDRMIESSQPEGIANNVIVIGEYTIPSGPFGDDHYFVFVFESGEIIESTDDKADLMLENFENARGVKVVPQLSNQTEAASVILFPPTLEGKPLLDFKMESNGISRWISLIRNFGVERLSSDLTCEVRAYIRSQIPKTDAPPKTRC
jgi:hypothetical protein